jgi:uracil phosphoribosyltransferase
MQTQEIRNPQLERLVYELRNPQTRSKDFREAIGEYLVIEIARNLETKEQGITTLLEREAKHKLLREQPTLIGILRAGISLYNGLQRAFPEAESGFIGAARDEKTLKAVISYIAIPRIEERTAILADTMLATGGSLIDSIEAIKKHKPGRIIIASAIASEKGIRRIQDYDSRIRIYAAQIDPELNDQGYIMPGLGDAGDRCYGQKI